MIPLLLTAGGVVLLGYAVRHYSDPVCPSCQSRAWDRKLCHPMLLCRRCATRVAPRRIFG